MKTLAHALLIAATLPAAALMPAAAQADARAQIRAKCEADVKAVCGLVFSKDKALACLIENKAKLSGACETALAKAACDNRAPDNLKNAFTCPG